MIKVICVGKIKEKYFNDALKEYLKRISKFTNIDIIELSDEGMSDIKVVMKKEKEKILKQLDTKSYVILLDREGIELSSISFAKKIESCLTYHSNITFVIGGSYGVDDEIKRVANEIISFSEYVSFFNI